MQNITKDMLRFKEAVRHTWNVNFIASHDVICSVAQESFAVIERELFRSMVLLPIGISKVAEKYRYEALPIRLQAKAGVEEVSVQFGSFDANRNIIWKLPCFISSTEISQYRFFEFFDWIPYGFIDLAYIKSLADDGSMALVEQMHCDFMLDLKDIC